MFDRHHYILIGANLAYLLPATYYFWSRGNTEFLAYVAVLWALFALVALSIHKSRFPLSLLWLLSLWAFLHVAGGGVPVAGGILYGLVLLDLFTVGDTVVVKYDQVVHAYGFFVATLAVYHLLAPQLKANFRLGVVLFVIICAGMGLGAVNEILEFFAAIIDPNNGVGGYFNTGLDLIANAIGASAAAAWVYLSQGKRTTERKN